MIEAGKKEDEKKMCPWKQKRNIELR
jgi:hypothetical protein